MAGGAGTAGSPCCASRRRAALRRCAAAARADALLVSRPQDVRYLSGFTGDDSLLLVGGAWACLMTDGRYAEQARRQCADLDVHVRTEAPADAISGLVKKYRVRRLAVQGDHLTVQAHAKLAKKLAPRRIENVSGIVAALRAVKDAAEVATVRKAIRIAERAFRQLRAAGAAALVGRTERHLAAELDYRMCLLGAEGAAFETIVAAAAHGSLPHYRPGRTRIRAGEAVLIDWGARVGGYCSDLTRVIFIGRIPPNVAKAYAVVLRAQRAGISAVRAGASCMSVDSAARKVIEAAGYGENFVHGLGHGIGLAVHEGPTLGKAVRMRLRSGMIVTVEPGIYLPGVGGVRIEDDVLVGARGCQRLSTLPRAPAAMIVR